MSVDDFKGSGYIHYPSWKEFNKGIIKRPYWNVFEDDGDVKTEEDDGIYNDEKLKWRVDKTQKFKYCTIIHYTGYQTYRIEVKETIRVYFATGKRSVTYFMMIRGSFKSNHLKGNNCGRLTFNDLQKQIEVIESLGIDSSKLKIDNLAPSILIALPFPVYQFLKDCLISYRGNPFKQYDPDSSGKVIGYYCPLEQIDVKLYDKSLQFNLPSYLMQFEDRFCKMQRLKKTVGIEYLSDLKDHSKVNKLLEILLQTWDDILIFDNTVDVHNPELNDRQREMVRYGDSSKFWEKLKTGCTPSTYKNRVAEFRSLSTLFGSSYHQNIRELIIAEWNIIINSCPKLPSVKLSHLAKFPSSVRGKNSQVITGGLINNNKLNMSNTQSKLIKSKKQISKERRDNTESQFRSFLTILNHTLQKLEKKAA